MAAMARLRLRRGTLTLRDLPLPAGSLVIGRAEDADLRLDVPGVSPHHVRLTATAAGVDVQFLDGSASDPHKMPPTGPLTAGDCLTLGDYQLELLPTAAPRAQLVVLDGPQAGACLPLQKTETRLGRRGGTVLALTQTAAGLQVTLADGPADLAINGAALQTGQCLQPGDVLTLAGVSMRYEWLTGASA